jgi:protein-S-isoprenylcysteine O-methyltransferase Ste14
MMRLVTFVASTAFLVALGAAMFLVAGTINLPSVWLYLALRVLFNAGCVLTMSEDVARERLKPGPGAKPERLFPIASGSLWVAHIAIAVLDLGRFGWSAGFPVWLYVIGVVGTLAGMGLVVWALRHNEYLSARIRIQGERGHRAATTGPYAHIRHPNNAGGSLIALASGLILGSWPSIVPMLLWVGLVAYRSLNEEKVLFAGLEGYREYAQKVRYRFLPGVW